MSNIFWDTKPVILVDSENKNPQEKPSMVQLTFGKAASFQNYVNWDSKMTFFLGMLILFLKYSLLKTFVKTSLENIKNNERYSIRFHDFHTPGLGS